MMTLQDAFAAVAGEQLYTVLRSRIADECPAAFNAMRLIDFEYTARKAPRGYNLVKRDHKKLGFVYYVRYYHEGRMLASKWCAHTNIIEKARKFAEQNRNELVTSYLRRCEGGAVRFFKKYYAAGSVEYRSESARSGELSEGRRKRYLSVMVNKFIPLLKKRRVKSFDQITVPLLDDFQDILLAEGLKPQSINDNMTAVNKAFNYLLRKGRVKENPCLRLPAVPKREGDRTTHGCYELDRLKGVFERRWKDKKSQLLNMLVYTTDMRNCEIKRFSKNDILEIEGVHFISVKRSKTKNGVRLVPLHETVYNRVRAYAKPMEEDEAIFNFSAYRFARAYRDLGNLLNADDVFLKDHNITFYSGRHFWKTLMNAEGLGEDVEEVFMGHRVRGDVSKLYNHRDMLGKKRLVRKAREVFKILDRRIFKNKT
ncbi:MAG: tyrosine-type recombinase/integrase [Treponema sp.]|jgi:integrase|nr:tyrosine-type recombinase/integrase [Treponema sp.]